MKKKKITQIDYTISSRLFGGTLKYAIPQILNAFAPNQAENIRRIADETQTFMNSPEHNDQKINSNYTSFHPYNPVSTANYAAQSMQEAETILKANRDVVAEMDVALANENWDQYPQLKSFLTFHNEIMKRSAEGRDVMDEIYRVPGAAWIVSQTVEILTKDVEPEKLNQLLSDFKYSEIVDSVIEYMDLVHALDAPDVSVNTIQSSAQKMKELSKKIADVSDHLMKDETANQCKDLFKDYNKAVRDARGTVGGMKEPASKALQALDMGWDPRFVSDYAALVDIHTQLTNAYNGIKGLHNNFQKDLLKKMEVVLKLNPQQQMFYSPEEFVSFYQKYSEALSAVLEESRKPELQDSFVNNAGDIFKRRMYQGFHGTAVMKLEYFAEKTNLKKQGIVVSDGAIGIDKTQVQKNYADVSHVSAYLDTKMLQATELFAGMGDSPQAENIKYQWNVVKKAYNLGASVEQIEYQLNSFLEEMNEIGEKTEPVNSAISFAEGMKAGLKEVTPKDFDCNTPLEILKTNAGEFADFGNTFAKGFEAIPRIKKLDYRFLSMVASNIAPTSGLLQFSEGQINEKYSSEQYMLENAQIQMLTGYDMSGREGEFRPNPYNVGGQAGYDYQVLANSYEQYQTANKQIAFLKEQIINLKNEPAFQNKPGIQKYFDFNMRLITDGEKGINRQMYIGRIPGSYYFAAFPDWSKKNVAAENKVDAFEAMITDMGFADAWEHLSARVDLDIEYEHAALNGEETAQLKDRIKELNNKLIADFEKIKAPENKKYETYFQNYQLNVVGVRGVDKRIAELKEQNAMLDAGWDPTRISDYSMLKDLSERAENSQRILGDVDDPKLDNLRGKLRKLADLNPSDQLFTTQRQFDVYYADYAQTLCDVLEEGKKKDVRDNLKRAQIPDARINGSLISAFVSNTIFESTALLARMEAIFDNVNISGQTFKGEPDKVNGRKEDIRLATLGVSAEHTAQKNKANQLKFALARARTALYKKHRIGFGGASKEMTILREKTNALYDMLDVEKRALDDPKVVKAAEELQIAAENYEVQKREADGVSLDDRNWSPKTQMGQVRIGASYDIQNLVKENFDFSKERREQQLYEGDVPTDSYFAIKLQETQNNILAGQKVGSEVARNIAKVIAIQTLAHKWQKNDMNMDRFPDSVLENATENILKTPGFKKLIPNPSDPACEGLIKCIANATEHPGNLVADYFEKTNQAKQIHRPEERAPQNGPVINGPV